MHDPQNQISHLLWCILVALRSATENHNITSERGRRKFISEWLNGARKVEAFEGMSREFSTIRQILHRNTADAIDDVLSALWMSAISTAGCDLFRYRAVLNSLSAAGWRHCLCPWPERLVPEIIARLRSRDDHILQLTRMEECFSATGIMTAPVTLQLLIKNAGDKRVQTLFHHDSFDVVQAKDLPLQKKTLRTLYIGHSALPETVWGAPESRCGSIRREDLH